MTKEQSPDFPEYDGKTVPVWDNIAEWWDDKIGDGNGFQDYLIEPASERLLELKPGERILDIACGAGRFTRRMASHGASILAIDHSKRFIRRAMQKTSRDDGDIEYRVMDATDSAEMSGLGRGEFDAAVCTMALMDMSSIGPMISVLPALLKPGGRFVFSVLHPAFHSINATITAEEVFRDGRMEAETSLKISGYIKAVPYRLEGIKGQPEPQQYFHRPISLLFNTCFKHGFVLDGIEEPILPEELKGVSGSPLSWSRIPQIPPILVARMRMKRG